MFTSLHFEIPLGQQNTYKYFKITNKPYALVKNSKLNDEKDAIEDA